MPGVSCARSPVCKGRKHTGRDREYSRKHPASPHAMVLTVSFVLSPAIGLSCHRRLRIATRKLDAGVEASGPHDFTVRKARALVSSAACVHHIPPRVRDDRDTPLEWDETAAVLEVIWVKRETEYFCR